MVRRSVAGATTESETCCGPVEIRSKLEPKKERAAVSRITPIHSGTCNCRYEIFWRFGVVFRLALGLAALKDELTRSCEGII